MVGQGPGDSDIRFTPYPKDGGKGPEMNFFFAVSVTFIVAVKGLSKNYIIENMKERVKNSQEEEFKTAIGEIHKIAKLRIKDLTY